MCNIKGLRLNVRRGLYLCLQKIVTIGEAKQAELKQELASITKKMNEMDMREV